MEGYIAVYMGTRNDYGILVNLNILGIQDKASLLITSRPAKLFPILESP